jgi:hypothetical protein
MKLSILGTPHEELLVIKNIQHRADYFGELVDIILLTEGLTSE